MNKKEAKQVEKMTKLLDKALKAGNIDDIIEVVAKEPFYSASEKYAVVFHLGRIYERDQFGDEIKMMFEQQEESKNENDPK